MPSIVAVDVDGVLVHGNDDNGFIWQQALQRDFSIGPQQLARFFQNDWDACILGQADLRDVLPAYLESWGFAGTVDDFIAYWFTHDAHLNVTLVAELDRLKTECRLVIATNQDRHRARFLWYDLQLRRQFERMFASSALGVRKPDQTFWRDITVALGGVQPADILLIDDSEANVVSAREFGWQAIHYRDRSDLNDLLGPV